MRARRTLVLVVLVVVLGVFVACGPTHLKHGPGDAGVGADALADATPLPHVLVGIVVTPTNPIVQLDLNTPGSLALTATGNYEDNVDEDLTASATWTVSNPMVGTMTSDVLAIPSFAASTAVTALVKADFGGLEGTAQITVVAYRQTGVQQDFFFVLPYQDPNGPATKPLDFKTDVPALDVFFLMDTTGSMAGEITNLQGALTGTVIPGIQAAVANSEFGVGSLQDFPAFPYGAPVSALSDCGQGLVQPDQPFRLFQEITNNTALVQTAVGNLSSGGQPIGCGDDWPEGGLESIYQAATGEGLSSPAPTNIPANHNGVGGVAFRQGTMPVIVAISDADSHDPSSLATCPTTFDQEAYTGPVAAVAHTRAQTKTALDTICARLVGVSAIQPNFDPTCTSQGYFEDLATTTGARVPPAAWDFTGTRPAGCASGECCTDFDGAGRAPDVDGLCPVVFRITPQGTGIGDNIVTGIQMLTRFASFDVTDQTMGVLTDIVGNPLPIPHTTADFLKTITPATFTLPPPPPDLPDPTFDATTFHGVTPGTLIGFNVNAFNDFVPQTDQPQIFRATIQVLAGGCTPLDQRDVLVLVPPTPITIQ